MDFSLTLACTVAESSGQTVDTEDVTDIGRTAFGEFKRD
ncbi:hypothetical protein LIG30_1738 [Burkholderia sp. lig30]|jgi:hypothetical protein|nr:hypothetical protein LIG30_1738 [Burkholderia sp. lig30]